MKRLAIAFLALAAAASGAAAQAPVPSIAAVHALTNQQAAQRLPARFEATVTYYRDYDIDLFVQDGDTALYVYAMPGLHLVPGDRVLITGQTQDSFRPIVVASSVARLGQGPLPKPVPATAAQLFSAQLDCRLATIQGIIRSAQMKWTAGKRNLYLQVLIDGGYIDAAIATEDESAPARLLDSEVELTGVVTSEFDQKMQQSGARLDAQSLSDVRILKPAPTPPDSLSITPIQNVLSGYHIRDLSQRLQVKGVITYYQTGRSVVLQSGSNSIWILTQTESPLRIGDVAYASGIPDSRNGYLSLDHSEVRDTGIFAPIVPAPVNWNEIGFGEHAFNLVSEEGQLLSEVREAAQDEFVLTSNGRIFSAIYRHPHGMDAQQLPSLKWVKAGSRIRVTGISMFYSSDPFNGPIESALLIRSFDDISVLAPPSWYSRRNLVIIIAALAFFVLFAAARGWQLERRMNRHSAASAARTSREAEIERQRSHILEKINGTGPLAEILELVAALASYRLRGAPCWCELKDGTQLGKLPPPMTGLVPLRQELYAGSDTPAGFITATLLPGSRPGPVETEILSMSANLASLAIATRRLYSDLIHRTEFDLLTDAHNRFFFEKELDLRIQLAEATGETFGILYFDLDGFKQINDSHGHRVGDVYLQQFAQRIRGQLRGLDKLARIGGDEFAVLVPLVHGHHDLEEIIVRLQTSLGQPIVIDNHQFFVSASFGVALYPDDGKTRDALLDAADSGMYAAKGSKRSANADASGV
ncbi:MAG TPA: GGDEF domain-containing protein [Terracidiphilus sp.]|jgi:diguanylate cyclase (GGDEF)-like protein|nr:GGDEF domain-containing protein [Terracidiphilus sp.]